MVMSSLSCGVSVAVRPWLPFGAWARLIVALAGFWVLSLVARQVDPSHAFERSVVAFDTLALPLLLALMVSRQKGWGHGEATSDLEILARHGAHRRLLVLGSLLGNALVGSIVVLAANCLVCLATCHPGQGRLLEEISTTAGIGLLGVVAYVPLLQATMVEGRRPLGPWVFLFLDNLMGRSGWLVALPFPGGHLRSLLGGPDIWALSPRMSSLALLLLAAAGAAISVLPKRP